MVRDRQSMRYHEADRGKSKLIYKKRKHGEDQSYFTASPSNKRSKPARTQGRKASPSNSRRNPARTGRRKGKKAERASSNSSDSDSDSEFIIKNRSRTTKFEQSSETDSMLKGNHSGGRLNDLLEESTSDYSTDGQNVTKRKRKKPTNCFGVARVNRSITNYRSNLKTLIKEIKALRFNETHLREIKMTPFWLMFDEIYRSGDNQLRRRCNKNEDDIRQIMLAFDALSECFMIGGELIPLVNRDVQLIFGITGGSKTIPLKVTEYETPPWIRRCFGQEINNPNVNYVLYKKYILEKLKETLSRNDENSVRDVARLTHCYLMAVVLSPNQNAAIARHLTVYLERFDEIGQYDWCTFIVDMLRSQIMSSKNLRAGGCMIMLPFWLCEHTRLVKPKNKDAFPRFLKWDLNDLHKKLSHVKLSKLEVHKLVLKPTSIEKDKFRALLKFCESEVQRQRNNPISEDEESHYDRADEAHGLSGDEDDVELIAKLGACGDLKPVNEASLCNKDNHEDIASTSKGETSNRVIDTPLIFRENIPSSSKPLDVSVLVDRPLVKSHDMPSCSLSLSQLTTPPPKVNDVTQRVIGDLQSSDNVSDSDRDHTFAEVDTQDLSLETEENSGNDEQNLTLKDKTGASEICKRIQRKCDNEMMKLKRKHQQEIQELQEIWEGRFAEIMKEHNLLQDVQLKELREKLLSSINDERRKTSEWLSNSQFEQHVENENRENDVVPSTSPITAPAEPIVCKAPVENIVTTNSQNEVVDQSKNFGDDEETVEADPVEQVSEDIRSVGSSEELSVPNQMVEQICPGELNNASNKEGDKTGKIVSSDDLVRTGQPLLPSEQTIASQDCVDMLPQQEQKDQTGRSLGSAELQESDAPAVENHRTELATLEPTATNSAPSLLTDPPQNELERLLMETAQLDKTLEIMLSQLKTDYEKEVEEHNSEIRKKNEAKRNELDKNLDKVLRNKILAEAFRYNCLDLRPSEVPGTRQVVPYPNRYFPGPSGFQPARPMQQPQSRPVPVAIQSVAPPSVVARPHVHSAALATSPNTKPLIINAISPRLYSAALGTPPDTKPLVINSISPHVGTANNNHCCMPPHLRPSSTSPSVSQPTMDARVSSRVPVQGSQASGVRVAKDEDN